MKAAAWFLALVLLACTGKSEQELLKDFQRANLLLQQMDYAQAIELYDEIIHHSPEFVSAINNRGIAFYHQGMFQQALGDYDKALELQPDYFDAAFNRTNALWALGRWQPALEELQFLTGKYQNAPLYFRIGQIQGEQDHLQEALKAYDKALEFDSTHVESWINRGNTRYYMYRFEEASRDLKKALELDPGNPLAMNTLALLHAEQGEVVPALSLIDEAIKGDPENAYFLNNKGYVYLLMDSLDLAENLINQSMLADPDNPWVYRNKAIWYLKMRNPQKSLELLEKARVLFPQGHLQYIYYYLGLANEALGDPGTACDHWLQGKTLGESSSAYEWERKCPQE